MAASRRIAQNLASLSRIQARSYSNAPRRVETQHTIRVVPWDGFKSMSHIYATARELEKRFGPIEHIKVPRDSETHRYQGYAWITFQEPIPVTEEGAIPTEFQNIVVKKPTNDVDRPGGAGLDDFVGLLESGGKRPESEWTTLKEAEEGASTGSSYLDLRVEISSNAIKLKPPMARQLSNDMEKAIARSFDKFAGFAAEPTPSMEAIRKKWSKHLPPKPVLSELEESAEAAESDLQDPLEAYVKAFKDVEEAKPSKSGDLSPRSRGVSTTKEETRAAILAISKLIKEGSKSQQEPGPPVVNEPQVNVTSQPQEIPNPINHTPEQGSQPVPQVTESKPSRKPVKKHMQPSKASRKQTLLLAARQAGKKAEQQKIKAKTAEMVPAQESPKLEDIPETGESVQPSGSMSRFDDDADNGLFAGGGKGAFGGFGGGSSGFGGGGLSASTGAGAGGGFGGHGFGASSFGGAAPAFGSPGEGFGGVPGKGPFHNRGDSATSDLSARSFHFGGSHLRQQDDGSGEFFPPTSGSVTPLATAANRGDGFPFPRTPSKTSLATAATPTSRTTASTATPASIPTPARKHSFASLRNAFKSSKSTVPEPPPPVPSLDPQQNYPALRNPFSRSATSLSQHPPPNSSAKLQSSRKQQPRTPSTTNAKSPSQSYSSRFAPQGYNRTRSNSQAASAHSHSSSVAHSEYSDFGDGSPNLSLDPPPVPRVPNQYEANVRRHRNDSSGFSRGGSASMAKPQKPHEYAVHVLFTKFVTCAEKLVEHYTAQSLYNEPFLVESLAQLARKHAQVIIESVLRWRNAHRDQSIEQTLVEKQKFRSQEKYTRSADVVRELVRRKDLATVYVMCRALVVIMRSVGKDGLDMRFGDQTEQVFFEEFVSDPNMQLLSHSPNNRANAELFAKILGEMATTRFVSVTDRFVLALSPLAAGQVLKDGGMRYENIIRGIEYIKLKVYPSEAFEESAEFLESLSKSFANAHGQRLKSAFAEVLTTLLHPVNETAEHEVNHPLWAKAIELMYPKANAMTKPRYWSVSYPLAVTLLCVAPHDYFLRNWVSCIEASVGKVKDKTHRPAALNGILRIVWTYLYRCQEPASNTTTKMDNLIKALFPAKWRQTYAYDEGYDSLACVLHYILARHPAYGRDVVLNLMQASDIMNLSPTTPLSTFLDAVPVDRVGVALRSILLTLRIAEKNQRKPSWPESTRFFSSPLGTDDLGSSATVLPDNVLEQQGMQEFVDRFAPAVSKLLIICGNLVGGMVTNDPKWWMSNNPAHEEREDLIIKHHPRLELSVVYHEQFLPSFEAFRIVIEALPRCLHPSANVNEVLDIIIRAVLHLDPRISDEAERCLLRFGSSDKYTRPLLARLTRFMFAPYNPIRETGPLQGPTTQQDRMTKIWCSILTAWESRLKEAGDEPLPESPKEARGINIFTLLQDIEVGGLYLLTSTDVSFRVKAVQALRMVPTIHRASIKSSDTSALGIGSSRSKRLIELLEDMNLDEVSLPSQNLPVADAEYTKLNRWRDAGGQAIICRMAESTDDVDGRLWRFILPYIVRVCVPKTPIVFQSCRDIISASVLRYHPVISALAQIQAKGASPSTARSPPPSRNAPVIRVADQDELEQWKTWIVFLCAAAWDSAELKAATKEHVRMPSDPASQRDRLFTPRGLFRHLIPFLMAEEARFRSSVIQALGCIHQSAYRRLLEDLQSITTHIYDDVKSPSGIKAKRSLASDRLYTAVMQVYRLTSHFARDPRTLDDHSTLSLLVQFVRESKTYLSDRETPLDVDALRVRRFFCGLVEMLFLGMASLSEADSLISKATRLALFRLCQQWCSYGLSPAQQRRYDEMVSGASSIVNLRGSDSQIAPIISESQKLSKAAAAAMTALFSPAFFASDLASSTPLLLKGTELDEPLEILPTIDWLSALFREAPEGIRQTARKALQTILSQGEKQVAVLDEVLRRAFHSSEEPTETAEFFNVITDVVLADDNHGFTASQVFCLGLSNLCAPTMSRRARSFNLLEKHASQVAQVRKPSFGRYEAAMLSTDLVTYLAAQCRISTCLAEAFPEEAHAVVAECALRLPQTGGHRASLIRALQPWVRVCSLVTPGGVMSADGHSTMINLFALTVRFLALQAEDIQALWQRLADRPFPHHASMVTKYLVEQCAVRGCPEVVEYAQHIFAGLSDTDVGPMIYEELCAYAEGIGDSSNSQPVDTQNLPPISDTLYTANLHSVISSRTRMSLSRGQIALLLVAEMPVDRPWGYQGQLPVLLHAVCTHLDHQQAFVQAIMQTSLLRMLWAWLPGYDEIPETQGIPSRLAVKVAIQALEDKKSELFWAVTDADSTGSQDIVRRIKHLCNEAISLLEPLSPNLRQTWGELAVRWAAQCPIPTVARRSVQVLRAIMPEMKLDMVASILHRLSNIISDSSKQIQAFSKEILLTLRLIVQSPINDVTLVSPLFWAATSFLSTTVEAEFLLAVEIFDALLEKIDLEDEITVQNLGYTKPTEWRGDELALQRLVIAGLRSSTTCGQTLQALRNIAKLPYGGIVDSQDDRLRYLFPVSLPWFLHAMEHKPLDPNLADFANDLANIAEVDRRDGIRRIMISFAKSRFRTKEDFLREAVGCLREYFMADHSTEVVTILLGLVLNSIPWVRAKSMLILKLIFGHAETREPLILHGSDLLMPLLRLLNTDLSSQALDVLDEPLAIAGGPSAAQVIRMSMHLLGSVPADVTGEIFGVPSESGWCIPRMDEVRDTCRHNLLAVYTTYQPSVPMGPISVIMFDEDEEALDEGVEITLPPRDLVSDEASVANLVSTLHDLGEFFQSDEPVLPASTNVEERVALILNRSLGRTAGEAALGESSQEAHLPDWQDPSIGIPGTPGPFAQLFSSPQNTMDHLVMNFEADSDDSESFGNDVRVQRTSSPHPYNSSDEENDAFPLEEGASTKRKRSLRNIIGSKLSGKNGRPERRRP
ncbi:Cell morphogenesis protein PAG1 [Tulasnella sp. 427]|nr:Cell morphogenesis protein PAG1 [Tulasnella sp. 427]